jgi:PAS domain S-box-containing protein
MWRGHRFFSRILLTVLGVMLPLLVLHAYTLYRQAEDSKAVAYAQVITQSRQIAAQLDQVLVRAEKVLNLLAARDDLKALDPARCEPVLKGMVTIDPLYVNIALSDMKGQVVCLSVMGNHTGPLRMNGPRWRAAVDANGLYLSSPINAGPIVGRPISVLSLPIRNAAGQPVGMVGISLDLLAIAEQLFAPGLPAGGSMTLVDKTNVIVTRQPEGRQWIGTTMPRSLRDARDQRPDGVVEATGPDGVTRAYATVPLARHDLRVAAGTPIDVALADSREALRRSYAVAALALMAALVVALYAAHWLSKPLQSLTRTARDWAQGRRDVRADERLPGEFRALAQEFNGMIGAREASEARLRESERRYAETLDGVDMLALTLTPEGLLSYCNDALLRLTGWQRGEVIGQSWARQFLPPDSAQMKNYLHGLVGDGEARARSEGHIVTRAGERRLIRWAHTALRSPEGQVIGSSSIGEDITERRGVELARQASAEAAAANQAKTEFLARMSHELRTPLNAVLGFSQLLQANSLDRLTPSETRQLEMIVMAGEQLRALIEDVLDVSRIEAGRMAIDAVEVEVCGVLDGVLRMSEASATPAGVKLVAAYAGKQPLLLKTDPVRLRQVLLNLVSNGIKYNRPGGRVTLDVLENDGHLHLVVADNGLGMTPQQLQTLFEPFNRLGREHTDISGTGIGMMLSRQLVQLLGGEMSVTSTADRGTTVHVSLPHAATPFPMTGPAPLDDLQPRPTSTATPSGRVLYIEDNPANAVLVQQLLSRWPGVDLTIAEDGMSGVRLAERLMPDLVLLDMQLPDIDGVRVLELLRERPATRDLRVVVLSAGAMPADVEKARRAGALDYWTKPIDFLPFLRGLAELLAHKKDPVGAAAP